MRRLVGIAFVLLAAACGGDDVTTVGSDAPPPTVATAATAAERDDLTEEIASARRCLLATHPDCEPVEVYTVALLNASDALLFALDEADGPMVEPTRRAALSLLAETEAFERGCTIDDQADCLSLYTAVMAAADRAEAQLARWPG